MTSENVSCFFSKNEKFSKTENFKFEMSSTVVRPAARVNISLIFFRKIEEVTLIDMSSFSIEYDRFHTLQLFRIDSRRL